MNCISPEICAQFQGQTSPIQLSSSSTYALCEMCNPSPLSGLCELPLDVSSLSCFIASSSHSHTCSECRLRIKIRRCTLSYLHHVIHCGTSWRNSSLEPSGRAVLLVGLCMHHTSIFSCHTSSSSSCSVSSRMGRLLANIHDQVISACYQTRFRPRISSAIILSFLNCRSDLQTK